MEPRTIPGYSILRELGRGGMGVVYLARQESLGREVALKVLPVSRVRAEDLKRFLREVRLAVGMSHPNVVKFFDAGATPEWAYLTMEVVDGPTLDRWLFEKGPMRTNQLLQAMEDLADALDSVHARRIIHRDIKSSNVMVARMGGVRLMDFGLARQEDGTELTGTDTVLGSPRYLAPETVSSGVQDALSDLYSLGVVYFEMATACEPFRAATLRELLGMITAGQIRAPSSEEPSIPPEVDAIILRLLAREPAKRYPDTGQLLSAIRALRAAPSHFGTSWETSRPAQVSALSLGSLPAQAPPRQSDSVARPASRISARITEWLRSTRDLVRRLWQARRRTR